MRIRFLLNGKPAEAEVNPGQTVLEFLRGRGIHSVKYGCDKGECGACTVLVDGKAQNACLMLVHTIDNKAIETVDGLADRHHLHPLQREFLDRGAVQCGYCTPGMILAAEALYRENPRPDEAAVRDALAGNLCRCTGYVKPVEAVRK